MKRKNAQEQALEAVNLLIVEDNSEDAALVKEMVNTESHPSIQVIHVESLPQGADVLEREQIDAILLNLQLSGSTGSDTFWSIREHAREIPIIILSSLADKSAAIRAVHEGAQDYLVKSEITGNVLVRSIYYAIERNRLRAKLLSSESRANVLVNRNTDGILLLNEQGMIKLANPAAENLFNLSYDKLIHSEFGFPLADDTPIEIELLRGRKRKKTVEMRSAQIEFEGEPHFLTSLRDVTERKLAEKKLEQKNKALSTLNKKLKITEKELRKRTKELEEETKYKSEFLANMSHELRSPLNSVILMSESLYQDAEKPLDAEQAKFVQIIHKSGKDLLGLINGILDLSKAEAGKMNTFVSLVRLDELVCDIELAYSTLAEQKGLGFNIEIGDTVPDVIITDHQKLDQIIRNLLTNALKFTEQGNIKVSIERPSARDKVSDLIGFDAERSLAISVTDTGIGISRQERKHLFKSFRQGNGSTVRKYGGTGLGLAISAKLAQLLNGNIKLYSPPTGGSRFTLYIPDKIDAPDLLIRSERGGPQCRLIEEKPTEASREIRERLNGQKILLIDEDMNNLFCIGAVLEKNSLIVEKARDENDAAEIMQTVSDISLILQSIVLPSTDGYQPLKKMRSLAGTNIPIIALTVGANQKNRQECVQAGADDWAVEPVNIDDLFEKMATLLPKS